MNEVKLYLSCIMYPIKNSISPLPLRASASPSALL